MKHFNKIYTLLFTILLSNMIFSQKKPTGTFTPYECSSYTPNTQLDKFVGHWKWTSGSDSFEMVLKKEKIFDMTSDDYACVDIIYGFHQYIKNGTTIESSLQNQNTTFYQDLSSIFAPKNISAEIIWMGIDNISNGNRVKMIVKAIDNTHIQIESLKNYEGVKLYPSGTPIPSSDITLPEGIILTKQ